MLISCVKEFHEIQAKMKLDDTNAIEKIVNRIISDHIQLEPIFSLKRPLKRTISKLDAVSKEEESND